MSNKKPKNLYSIGIAAAITVAGLVVFGSTLVHAVIYAPDGGDSPAPSEAVSSSSAGLSGVIRAPAPSTAAPLYSSVSSDLPSRLQIPALSIDAHVQDVGTNGAGNMSAPSNFTDVAWYKYGTVPGKQGSAVMAGHVDNGLSLAGVFKHLDSIKPGDDIYVVTSGGERLRFAVASVDSYDYKSAPVEQIFGQGDKAYLKLLTCTGDWVQGDRTYDHRLVVTAVLAS